jgi:N6-adenosine-specific RNA methylase IME4
LSDEDNALMQVTADGSMVIGGFEFTTTGLKAQGERSFEEWDAVGHFLRYIHTGAQFWIGDWLNYGEKKYGEKYTQALEHTGYELKTLENYAWIAKSVPDQNRKEKIPFGHYANGLAALSETEQAEWIERILAEDMSQSEFRQALRIAKRAGVSANAQLPEGKFRVIYTDNPWQYDDSGVISSEPGKAEAYGKAERHFPTMSIEEQVELFSRVYDLALDDAVMFMWVPAPLLLQNPGPREVIEAAGFEYKNGFVWDKATHNYGHYISVQHEHLLICTRGSCVPDRLTPMLRSIITSKRTKTHSEKPEEFRKAIMRLYDGPYLELFGRKNVEGWTVFGNDLALQAAKEPQPEAPKTEKKKTKKKTEKKKKK